MSRLTTTAVTGGQTLRRREGGTVREYTVVRAVCAVLICRGTRRQMTLSKETRAPRSARLRPAGFDSDVTQPLAANVASQAAANRALTPSIMTLNRGSSRIASKSGSASSQLIMPGESLGAMSLRAASAASTSPSDDIAQARL